MAGDQQLELPSRQPAPTRGLRQWSDQCGQRVRERALRGMDDATRAQLTHLLEQVRDNLTDPTD